MQKSSRNHWLIHNLTLKIVALVLAVITWFYINGELIKYGH